MYYMQDVLGLDIILERSQPPLAQEKLELLQLLMLYVSYRP